MTTTYRPFHPLGDPCPACGAGEYVMDPDGYIRRGADGSPQRHRSQRFIAAEPAETRHVPVVQETGRDPVFHDITIPAKPARMRHICGQCNYQWSTLPKTEISDGT